MKPSTHRLVDDASRGYPTAVESLLARYLPALRRYVARRAGSVVLARESGTDVVQSACREVLERLADGRFEYQGERQFKQWLYTAALLKISERRRYHLAAKRHLMRETSRPLGARTSVGLDELLRSLTTPSEVAMRREQLGRLRRTFDLLPDDYRQVILLARIDQLPHREVAARMGISESHSRVLLSRALARLALIARRELDH